MKKEYGKTMKKAVACFLTAAVEGTELNHIRVFGTLTIRNGTLSGNMSQGTQTENVRGIQVYYGGRLQVDSGIRITGYHTNGCGAGIYVNYGGHCSLGADGSVQDSCVISGNKAEEDGGGIWSQQADSLILHAGTIIKENQAGQNGGGIAIGDLNRKSYTLGSGVTISDNQAEEAGGGLYVNCNKIACESTDPGLLFDGAQITGNTAVELSPVVSVVKDGDQSMIVWRLEDYPLQAEDDLGKISYSCKEETQAERFVLSYEGKNIDSETCKITFTAWNSRIYRLPQTGGCGIWIFQVTGISLMLSALYLYCRKRKIKS